jgi:hypothetical protein
VPDISASKESLMSIRSSIHKARETLARLDAENSYGTTQVSGRTRAAAAGRNLFEAGLETLNALPATHMISGPASVVYGLGKIAFGGIRFLFGIGAAMAGGGSSDLDNGASSYVRSGFKTAALGGVAMIPAVGWIPNAVAAGLDVVDAANSAFPATEKKSEPA